MKNHWLWLFLASVLCVHAISCTETPTNPPRDNALDQQNAETGGDPFALAATVGASAVILNWQAPEIESVWSYAIKRRTGSSGAFVYLAGVLAGTTSYEDRIIDAGYTYEYKIAARDADGVESEISHQVAVLVHSLAMFSINNGAQSTPTREVTLHVRAADCDSLWVWDGALADSTGGEWRIKSGDVEVLNWTLPTGPGDKMVHARLHYATGLRSQVSAQISPAPVTATGVVIGDGSDEVSSNFVVLNLAATNAVEMRVSASADFPDAEWIAFAPTLNWNLATGEPRKDLGEKTVNRRVFVQYRNDFEMSSMPVPASVLVALVSGISILDPDGDGQTLTRTVDLELSSPDADEMIVGNDAEFTGREWQAYTTTLEGWELLTGPGTKTVYAKFRNASGVESEVVTASVEPAALDATLSINEGAQYTMSRQVELALTAVGGWEMMISNDPDFSNSEWATYSETWAWELLIGDGPKTVYAKMRNDFEIEQAISDSIILDMTGPDMSGTEPMPEHGAVVVANPVVFSWTTATDLYSGVAGYRVLFGTADPPIEEVYSGPETTYLSGVLDHGVIYYWRVVAVDSVGNETAGEVWAFSTTLDDFVLISAGQFEMGSPEGEPGRYSNEDQHMVTLTQSFWLSPYEVTEEFWADVMDETQTPSQLPKNAVSWNDAIQFCNAISLIRGLEPAYIIHGPGHVTWNPEADGYRLPTEAEWEYACRAGTTEAYSNGTNCLSSDTEANFRGDAQGQEGMGCPTGVDRGQRTVVGIFPANPWGLYDMHGNVWEWCWDVYAANLGFNPVTNPVGGGYDQDASGLNRVLRGVGWGNGARYCRSAYRFGITPSYTSEYSGFRLARTAF